MVRTKGLTSQAEMGKTKKMKYVTSTPSSIESLLLKHLELPDESLALWLDVLNLTIEEPSSTNTKSKSQDVMVVEEDSSSTKLEEVRVLKDTYYSKSSWSWICVALLLK